jgi:hypothetical protein
MSPFLPITSGVTLISLPFWVLLKGNKIIDALHL